MDRHVRPTHGAREDRITVEDWLTELANELKPEPVPAGWKTVQEIAPALGCSEKAAAGIMERRVVIGKAVRKTLRVMTKSGMRQIRYYGPA